MKYIILMLAFILASNSYAQDKLSIKVQGACGMCKDRIEETALKTIGVLQATWDEETKVLLVVYDKGLFDEKELHKNIALAGHDTDQMEADANAYAMLPACCAYKNIEQEHPLNHDHNGNKFDKENHLSGLIYEVDPHRKKIAIIGANIFWEDGSAQTISSHDGSFSIPYIKPNKLIVSYVGYQSDTIWIEKAGAIAVVLSEGIEMNEVEITAKKRAIEVSYLSPIKLRKISQREFLKAACCNLSESFETNPAVDVSFTDAVTGTKQIEMLGLSGSYVQITRENMPDVRGLASIYGLSFIPGPFVESIQLNLGSGSVINGFESIAGQINVELLKPGSEEKLHVNGYYGSGGRIEGNVMTDFGVSKNFDANLLLHYNTRQQAHDQNFDGFIDMPKGSGYSLVNNWRYYGDNGNEGQFGFKITNSENIAGQDPEHHEGHPVGFKLWKFDVTSNRYEAWIKRGKAYPNKPYKSIGFQMSGFYYDQDALFGDRKYEGKEKMIYGNLIYKTIIGDTDHKITFGSSFQAEVVDEIVDQKTFHRNEVVPGLFGEYSYAKEEKFDLVLGLRADHHNNFGLFFTPRLHTRYAVSKKTVLRASVGRGQRTANIFAENIGAFASSRSFEILNSSISKNPYGLNAEVAWNFGLNSTHDFTDKLQWGVDIYSTIFQNQIVVDYEENPQKLLFYNLSGKSFSNSFQTQLDYEIIRGLDLRLAYRYNHVKIDYQKGLLQKPFTSPHRAFANIAYETKSGWKFDYTVNFQGVKRLPSTASNPSNYRLGDYSDAFIVHNTQLTKVFNKKFEMYVGGENIFGFRQSKPIISAGDPYGKYFDASLVWGPVFGSMWYGGFRYRILQK